VSKENLSKCPKCGSDDLHNKEEPTEGENTTVVCGECGEQWEEPYEFAEE